MVLNIVWSYFESVAGRLGLSLLRTDTKRAHMSHSGQLALGLPRPNYPGPPRRPKQKKLMAGGKLEHTTSSSTRDVTIN